MNGEGCQKGNESLKEGNDKCLKGKRLLSKKKKKKKEEKNHLYNLRNFKYKFQILKRQHYIEFIINNIIGTIFFVWTINC